MMRWLFFLLYSSVVASVQIVKIAHLLPNNPNIVHEPKVLQMCIQDLKEKRILPKEIEFRVETMESCNRFSGVENAAYLHYMQNASVYFGPGCNNEMAAIGRLVSRWNVPIIAHLSGDDALSDRTIFDTLGSVALTSATEMAKATLEYLKLYNFKQIGFVRASVNFDRLSLHSLKNLLKENEIELNVEIEVDPFATPDEIIATGKLKTLRNKARIILVEMGMDLHASRAFMVAAHRYGIKTNEFVFILPWLSHVNDDHMPWEATTVDRNEVRIAYEGAIVITAHGYDRKFVEEFELRFAKKTGIITSHHATLAYLSLHDALMLYGLAVSDTYKEMKSTKGNFLDGKLVWKKMTNRQFIGVTGQVLMNNKAIRVPSYATYYVTNGSMNIVVELTAKLLDPIKCAMAGHDCSEHVAHEVVQQYWASYDGALPPDFPRCGFSNELCDYTNVIIGIGLLAFVGLSIPIGYIIYIKEKERQIYNMTWRIERMNVRLLENTVSSKSETSLGTTVSANSGSISGSFGSKANNRLSAKQAIANGVKCAYKRYAQTRNITFQKSDLKRLKELKLIENENLNKFYGICFNQQNEFLVLWVLCQRGSLEDVLFNDELKISRNFQISFAKDVVKGIHFLHTASEIKYHGFLCLQNCLVDSNWGVKLTNFVTQELISDKIRHNEIKHMKIKDASIIKKPSKKSKHAKESDESEPETEPTESFENILHHSQNSMLERSDKNTNKKIIQQAPEVIREIISTKFIPPGSQAADIYSLGMVLYQILFKLEPFHEQNYSISRLIDKIALSNEDDQILRPAFPSQQNGHEEAYNLQLLSAIEACWLEIPEMRPNIKRIKTLVNTNLKSTSSGTLVDQMVRMMEDYTINLESLVKDRTAMLEDAQQQADRLLKNMLPPSIAEDLKMGKPVIPKLYENATVLFISINNFSRISSMSTAVQIVNFLNDVFGGFDAIISKQDAYKVETIGDTYLIVSGLPRENGNAHVFHVSEIALKIRMFVANFKMSYKVDELLLAKIGFHSGPVAAGVIGLSAPRFCIFGDTVNVASRMQSTGITESSYNLIQCFYQKHYVLVERGLTQVKGKGEILTYFLKSKKK